jgi:DNA processing protein
MALICHASVIVEAGESSGTLSQGWEALRLGRPLFLLRSVVDNRDLTWPREMVQYGAFVLTKFEELLEVLPEAHVPAEALAF